MQNVNNQPQQPYQHSYPHQPNMHNVKFCKSCRSIIDKGAKICPYCRTKQNSNVIGCGIGIIAALILIPVIAGGIVSKDSPTISDGKESNLSSDVDMVSSTDEKNEESPWATNFTSINDFRYSLDNEQKTITLERYVGEDTKILLSPVYNIDGTDYRLVSMGNDACFLSETYITSVYIPEGVTYIGASCFNSCSSLEYLYIPATAAFEKNFLSYLHEYNVNYNSVININNERDMTNYTKVDNSVEKPEEAGEDIARAFNGLMGGLDTPVDVNIYYGGTEEQWASLSN